jgi:predicted phosphodiesterase
MKLIGNYWLGVLLYVLLAVIAADLLRLLLGYVLPFKHIFVTTQMHRIAGCVCALVILIASIWGVVNARIIHVTPYDVTVDKTVEGMDEMKVVLVADLHLGYNIGEKQMQQMVDRINEQDADLVVIAGDIFDNEWEAVEAPETIAATLRSIRSKYGVYACYGNHDIEEPVLAGFTFRQSEKLQQHVEFLYAKGSVYHIENGNLLYHGAVPMTRKGTFAVERFEGHAYSGRALMDYCDERARRGYFAPEGSAARQSGQDFLWYLWCGKLSPLYGRSAMTTFERLYVEDASTHTEVKDPYYTWYNEEAVCRRILAEFGLPGTSHIVNGHVPVQEKKGESPIKGGGRLVVIDGGFCRAYHEKTGIAGYTLVYSSRTMSLRTHQPFESAEKAVNENLDILSQKNILETENHRILVEETDEGETLREKVHDLKQLVRAYQLGWIKETRCDDSVW